MVLSNAVRFMGRVGWPWWLVAVGGGLGLAKSQLIMVKTAQRNVERAFVLGRDWLLNLYALKTWVLVGSMIALGIVLRTFGPTDNLIYRHVLAALYLAVGLGLLLSDRIYWLAVFRTEER
jgi:hypothetical protein